MRRRWKSADDARLLGPLGRLGHACRGGPPRGRACRSTAGIPRGHRAARRALLHHGGQSSGQSFPAHRVEAAEHVGAGRVAFALEERGQLGQRDRGRRGGAPALQPAVAVAMSARPSCCTSRSRTAPSRRPSQPSSSRNTWARTGSTSANSASAARRRRVATRMSWSSSGSSPSRVPGLLLAEHGQLAAQHGEGELAHGRGLGDRRSGRGRAIPGISWPMARRPASNFDRRGRLEPARGPQLLDDRLQRVEPLGPHLDLDPAQLHRSLAVRRRRSWCRRARPPRRRRRRRATRRDGAGCGPGAPRAACVQPTMARRRRPTGPSGPSAADAGGGEDLGDLETLAQAAALGGAGVLQGDLVVTATPAGADDEPGAGDAPVVGVEVGVDQPPRRPGQRGDRRRRRPSRPRGSGSAASQRSTGRRSRASNCHSISTGSPSAPAPSSLESDTRAQATAGPRAVAGVAGDAKWVARLPPNWPEGGGNAAMQWRDER